MAGTLYITDNSGTVNIWDGTYKVRESGWNINSSNGHIWETFEIVGQGSNSDLRAVQGTIDTFFDTARK